MNHLKSWALKGCTPGAILAKSVPASVTTSRSIHWPGLSVVFGQLVSGQCAYRPGGLEP